MDFPKERMEYSNSHGANTSQSGWLVLNINGLDLEGVHKLYIDLSEMDSLREKRSKKADTADFVRSMFAKKDPGEDE